MPASQDMDFPSWLAEHWAYARGSSSVLSLWEKAPWSGTFAEPMLRGRTGT